MIREMARQSTTSGRWYWVVERSGQMGTAGGYCAGWHEWTQEELDKIPSSGMSLEDVRARQEAEDGPYREKFHRDGHETREEAERCQYGYELDHVSEFSVTPREGDEYLCEAPGSDEMTCDEPADGGLGLYGSTFQFTVLCREHRTKEVMQEMYPFRPNRVGQRE